MLVAGDVFQDVKEVLGRCDQSYVYRIMSDAIECLANKTPQTGPAWQPLLIYVNLPVTQGYYVTLPAQVETCLRVNMNKRQSFPRAQLYEFTMNSPGSDDKELGWGWQERGDTPIQQPIPFPTQLAVTCTMANDAGAELQLLCVLDDQTEQWVTYGAQTVSPNNPVVPSGPVNVIDIAMISKPVTVGPLSLVTAAGTLLAVYQPNDTAPSFQRIKLSQKATAVRIFAKRKTAAVAVPTDIIPLNSKMAIVLMCKALKYYKEDHYQEAATCETAAIHYLEEEQASRLSYSQLSAQIDTAKTLSANIKNRDTIIVADVYDELCDIFGPIGMLNVFDNLTTAIELLANKSHWDPLIGYCDICVQNAQGVYYVTLPRFIDQIVAMNVNNQPGDFRSKWFEFHMNGLGSSDTNRPCRGWEEVGEFPYTFTWPNPVNMCAVPDMAIDNNANIRLFGLDANWKPLTSPDGSDGLLINCIAGSAAIDPNQPPIMTIDRVVKDVTTGYVSLYATDGNALGQLIAYWWPIDTEPVYRRIKLGTNAALVRLRYRKRWNKIQSLVDPIPLRSRIGICSAARAVQMAKTDPQGSDLQLQAAVAYVNDEWRVSHPRESAPVQINSQVYGGNFTPVM